MNNRAFTISFVVALLAVMMVYSYVSSTEEAYRQRYGVDVAVVVAKRDVKELDLLDETNLTTKNVPKEFVQPGTSTNPKEFMGALAVAPIMKDEQVTKSKVTQLGARTGLARQVAVGKRAVTINVSDNQSVAKLIKPGDRVDVLANIDPTGTGNKLAFEVRTILQDVLVLATGKYVTNTVPGIIESDQFKPEIKTTKRLMEYTAYPNVTLEVDPLQAQTLVFAQTNFNGVYLVLRNNDDSSKDEMEKTKIENFLKGGAPLAPRPQVAPPPGGILKR